MIRQQIRYAWSMDYIVLESQQSFHPINHHRRQHWSHINQHSVICIQRELWSTPQIPMKASKCKNIYQQPFLCCRIILLARLQYPCDERNPSFSSINNLIKHSTDPSIRCFCSNEERFIEDWKGEHMC